MKFVFKNNAISSISSTLLSAATTITLASGTGALFPSPGAQEQFVGTLIDVTTGLLREIVFVTQRTGETLTVLRGQEGTTPQEWPAGTIFAELVTAAQMDAMVQDDDLQGQDLNYTNAAGTNTLTATFVPALTAPVPGVTVRLKIANTNTGPVTLDVGPGAGLAVQRRNGTPLVGGELQAGDIVEFRFSDANNWRIAGVAPATAAQVTAGTDQHSAVTPAQLASQMATFGAGGQWGMVFSRANDTNILITAGAFASDDRAAIMAGAQMSKGTTAGWTAGNGGGLFDGTPPAGAGSYYLFAIKNMTSGAVDYLASESISPNLAAAAGFTKKRLIGWYERDASMIIPFHTYETEGGGIEFMWDVMTLDIESEAIENNRLLHVVRVPDGLQVEAILNAALHWPAGQASDLLINLCHPDQTEGGIDWAGPRIGVLGTHIGISMNPGSWFVAGMDNKIAAQVRVRTNTSRQIASRLNRGNIADPYEYNLKVSTVGFRLARR